MRIVAIADQHGFLPDIPACDMLLIAGDVCPVSDHTLPSQLDFLNGPFRRWLDAVPAKHVAATWGNHDFIGQESPDLVPKLRWNLLVDRAMTIEGYRIYATPWQPVFMDWAFNLTEPQLERKWSLIDTTTEILVCHGPPHGYGDNAPRGNRPDELVGSPSLLARIERIRPRLVVCGHIHNGRGRWELPGHPPVTLANVTVLDERYNVVHAPMVFDLPDK